MSAATAAPSRSRRSVLHTGLAGLAGLALGALGRPRSASAAAGAAILMGQSNDAAGTNTTLGTTTTGTALQVNQNGTGTALRGVANNGIAGFFSSGMGAGVSGVTGNNTKYGVYAANDAAAAGAGAALRANGKQNHGAVVTTDSLYACAVKAVNTSIYQSATGIVGIGAAATEKDLGSHVGAGGVFLGLVGAAGYGSGDNGVGVMGIASGPGQHGIYAVGPSIISGDLQVNGALTKASGAFKIDHPLDPAGKYLYHSFVESPDMKNVYDGVAALDAEGEATVELPEWFEALNRDLRYQLTAVGPSARPIHVKEKLRDGRFSIAGGEPGQEVCWQVTGIRRDAWANAHRIPVEEPKPVAESGLYLHPVEHSQPKKKGIEEARQAALGAHTGGSRTGR